MNGRSPPTSLLDTEFMPEGEPGKSSAARMIKWPYRQWPGTAGTLRRPSRAPEARPVTTAAARSRNDTPRRPTSGRQPADGAGKHRSRVMAFRQIRDHASGIRAAQP